LENNKTTPLLQIFTYITHITKAFALHMKRNKKNTTTANTKYTWKHSNCKPSGGNSVVPKLNVMIRVFYGDFFLTAHCDVSLAMDAGSQEKSCGHSGKKSIKKGHFFPTISSSWKKKQAVKNFTFCD
jgi:hypothetical protein